MLVTGSYNHVQCLLIGLVFSFAQKLYNLEKAKDVSQLPLCIFFSLKYMTFTFVEYTPAVYASDVDLTLGGRRLSHFIQEETEVQED